MTNEAPDRGDGRGRRVRRAGLGLLAGVALGLLSPAAPVRAEEEIPVADRQQPESLFLVGPLAGWNRNELLVPGRPGTAATRLVDGEPEYGLFLQWGNPRVVVNNMTFFTQPNDTDTWGDFLHANVYGDPKAACTWNLGAGYLWHQIGTEGGDIDISLPMVKAGLVVRVPRVPVTFNPYVGAARERVDAGHGAEESDSLLYGLMVRGGWRMLQASAQYYCQDDLDRDEQYDVLRTRLFVFLTKRMGLAARFEYMEQAVTKNTSFLLGPVFAF